MPGFEFFRNLFYKKGRRIEEDHHESGLPSSVIPEMAAKEKEPASQNSRQGLLHGWQGSKYLSQFLHPSQARER